MFEELLNEDSPFVDILDGDDAAVDSYLLNGDRSMTAEDLDNATATRTKKANVMTKPDSLPTKKRISIYLPGLKINYKVEECIFNPEQAMLVLIFDEDQEYSPEFQETNDELKIKLQLPGGEITVCSYLGQSYSFNGFKHFILVPESVE